MKIRYLISSLFFCIILLAFKGCTPKSQENSISLITAQSDSLNQYYIVSKSNIDDFENSIIAIDQYISGSKILKLDSLTCRGYMLKTRILAYHRDYNSALKFSSLLLQTAIKNMDSSYMGKAYNKLGLYKEYQGEYVAAFNYYNESFKIHRNTKDSLLASKRVLAMANTQAILGDYVGSNITAVDGLKYLPNTPNLTVLLGLYHSLSISYREQKNYKQALFWNNKTLELSKAPSLSKKISLRNRLKFQNTRANILSDKREYDKAISILEELLDDALQIKDSTEYARFLSNLGKIKWLKNSMNKETESMLLNALVIRQKTNNNADLISSHIHLAKYFADKDIKKAIYYAKEAYNHSTLLKNQISILESLDILTTLDSTRILDYRELKKHNASLKEKQKQTRQIYEPTRFENERLTKENEENIIQIAKEKNQKKWLAVILVLSLIGGFIFVQLQRKVQKEKNRTRIQKNAAENMLQIHQAENRLSKKVHDAIANKIYLVKLLINKDVDKLDILKKLDVIYAKARDISRERTDINFEDYSEELENMVLSYDSEATKVFIVDLETMEWEKFIDIHKVTIYKVIQELMTNMDKHSSAAICSIVFSQIDRGLKIVYTDNGVGIPWNQLLNKNGTSIMENLVKKAGGSITFDTKRKSGVKIFIQIPESL